MNRLGLLVVVPLITVVLGFADIVMAKPLVMVSVEPLALVVREICADDCEVVSLVPRGVSEHIWQPGPKDVVKAKSAKASIGIGLEFDDRWFKKIDPTPSSMLWLGDLLNPMSWWSDDMTGSSHKDRVGTKDRGHDHDHDHTRQLKDPHVWTDAGRMSLASNLIGAHLAKIFPGSAKGLTDRGQALSQRLLQLQLDVDGRRKSWRTRPVVMFHDVAGYFARRFNLPVLSVSAGNSGHELSAHMIADVSSRFRNVSVAAILVEREDGAAKSLARELKTKIKVVDFSASRNYSKWDEWYLHIVTSWEDVLR